MSKVKTRRIRAVSNFAKATEAELLSRGQSVVNGMTGNPAYPNPPVDPATLKAALETYSKAIADAVDGSKKAIAARDRQRETVIRMLRGLSNYVELASNDDLPTLLSSGFEPLTITRSAPQPLPPTSIRRIDHGSTGQLLVKIDSVPKAWSYELRYASLGSDGAPGPWSSRPITAVTSLAPCNGLTPGTTYAFQVRTLGRLGFSDWSDSATKMCT